jgi:hypothetical protein
LTNFVCSFVTDQRALLLSAVNFDSPQSHSSVSVSDALALQRLAQRRTLAHATRLTLVRPVSGSAASALDGAPTAVLEITASLTWLLSDAFRRTFATVGEFQLRSCAPCDARSHAVAVRGARLSLHIDDDSFRALGLASRSVDLSVPGSVGAVARRTLDALPAFQSLSMLASWCVDGVQSDIAAALAALPAAEQPAGWRLVPTKRSSVRRSSVRVPKVAGDIGAAAASELVEYCAAAAIGATAAIGIVSEGGADCRWRLPSALPLLAGAQSVDVHTLGAGMLHPRQVVALVERLVRESDAVPWACLTVRGEPDAVARSRDAVSFIVVDGHVRIVACGRRV